MRRIVAILGALVAAVAMSIGGASVASADDFTVQNAAIGLWPAADFVGTSEEQVLPGPDAGGNPQCQTLQLVSPGSIANTGNGTVDFFPTTDCTGVADVTLISGADDSDTTDVILLSASST